jgi:hypothetical protein
MLTYGKRMLTYADVCQRVQVFKKLALSPQADQSPHTPQLPSPQLPAASASASAPYSMLPTGSLFMEDYPPTHSKKWNVIPDSQQQHQQV